MPIKELIQSLEDRELTSGPGNWTTDFTWYLGPYWGQSGYIERFHWPPFEKTFCQLNYPALDSRPGKTLTLTFLMSPSFHQNNLTSYYVRLLDGTYSLDPTSWNQEAHELWTLHTLIYSTPADWNKLNGSLRIEVINGPWWTSILRFDNFSLIFDIEIKSRVDHLPLMGIGR